MLETYKYIAFISYKREDERWARWIQRKLEFYHVPLKIKREHKSFKNGIRSVFRDKTDLDTGVLADNIKKALEQSKFLIIVCSPNAANSKWVNDEISYFLKLDRHENIIPVIVNGHFGGELDECVPEVLRGHWEKHSELLCLDIRELGRAKTIVQIAARIFGVDSGSLWSRYKSYKRQSYTARTLIIALIALFLFIFAIPITLKMTIDTENKELPFDGLVLTTPNGNILIENRDTFLTITMPGYYKLKNTIFRLEGNYFYPTQLKFEKSILVIGPNVKANVKRDDTFRRYKGTVIDAERHPIEHAEIEIDGVRALTDKGGEFEILFPAELQTETKPITISAEGYNSFQRNDERPGNELIYILSKR